jgi:MFS family permease
VTVFFDPCKLAILPDLVHKRQLLRANSLLATTETITEMTGFAVGGFVSYYLSTHRVFAVDSVTFVVSAFALLLMAYRPKRRKRVRSSGVGTSVEIREGISFLMHHRGLMANTGMVAAAALGLGASYPLTFLYAARVIGGGARSFGLMESAIAFGYLLAAVAMASVGDRVRKGLATTIGIGVMGAGLTTVSVISNLYFALVPFFVIGAANAVALISIDTYFQETLPEELRGRVLGVRFMITQGVFAASIIAGGALATRVDVPTLFIGCGTLVALPAIVGMYISAVRRA